MIISGLTPELVLFQSPGFRTKLFAALGIVAKALAQGDRPYIAFSGGKDSVALAGVVHAVRDDVPLLWSDDELEYPEAVDFMRQLQDLAGEQLTVTLGSAVHAGWFRPWASRQPWRDPLPGSTAIYLDADDWQGGRGHNLTFTGLRMDENHRRKTWLTQVGPLYRVKSGTGLRCCPLWDWTADDVWALIHGWGLAYCPVYDRLEEISVPRHQQRLGPLPLARRQHLEDGWPELLNRLESTYGKRWD